MSKILIRLVVSACLSCLLFPGIVFSQTKTPIRLGILPVVDTLPLQVAVREGLFAEQGLEVELVNFASALERDTAMQAGRLDGYFGDMIATLLLVSKGIDMRMVTVSYETSEGQRMFGVVTAPQQADLAPESLKGKRVGISRSTIIEYLLHRMEAAGELAPDALEPVEIKKIPIRLQLLLAGEIDTALLPEPLLALAESRGGTVLATDEKLGMVLTVLSLKSGLSADDVVREAFLAAYDQAVQHINHAPEKYRALMAETCRIPGPLVASFPVHHFPRPHLPAREEVEKVQRWMLGKGMLKAPLDYGDVVSGS